MKKASPLSITDLVLTGAFAAILAALSQLSIPLPSGIPITMQTFAVALCGFTLGARQGFMAVLVYLLLGAVGLPVFAGFQGGVHILLGVTGGFLWGFLCLAALCGIRNPFYSALGLAACHLLGVLQFVFVAGVSLASAFTVASLPYLLKDIASVALAYAASRALLRGLRASRLIPR